MCLRLFFNKVAGLRPCAQNTSGSCFSLTIDHFEQLISYLELTDNKYLITDNKYLLFSQNYTEGYIGPSKTYVTERFCEKKFAAFSR